MNNNLDLNIIKDIDVKEKLIELSEKVDRSENNIIMIKNTNEKLLEIINNFKNLEILKNKNSNSGKNSKQNSPKKIPIKRRCYSPSVNNINIKINNNENNKKKENNNSNHKKAKSINKKKVFIETNNSAKKNNNDYFNYNKLKEYSSRISSYSQIYNRDKNKNKKIKKNKIYNYKKIKSNRIPLIRHTIFLTGNNNNSSSSNNYNKNINFKKMSYEIGRQDSINGINFYHHSFPSSRKNNNNSQILMTNEIGNIYQKQIMKLPPQKQPLFYESNSKFYINNFLFDINGDSIDTISFNEQKMNFDEKFNFKNNHIFNKYLESNENGNNNNITENFNKNLYKNKIKENKTNRNNHKNKLLNFKDFQIIFEENELDKKITQTDDNIINKANMKNNSYRNKFIEKNLINKKNIYNNNKINIHSLKNDINKKKINNEIKENGNVFKNDFFFKENGFPKLNNNINKYSDYINKKYKNLFEKQSLIINDKNDNGKINNNGIINKNKNNFMIPFYLINCKDLYKNILNSSIIKK